MENKVFDAKGIPQGTIDEIVGILQENSIDNWREQRVRKMVVTENLMIRAYVHDPSLGYSACRRVIQPQCKEYYLEDGDIRSRAEKIRLTERKIRAGLADWAYDITRLIYDGMAGDAKALKQAKALIKMPYDPDRTSPHISQERMVLLSMFEFIPELKKSPINPGINFIGMKLFRIYLNKILDTLAFDAQEPAVEEVIENAEALKRELYLARQELIEYKALVEAEDAEYDDKIEELKQQEISGFFSALNNEKYGFIIDTVYLLNRACAELKRSKTELPYAVQGVPALLERMLKFFKDVGILPASKFAPHSVQHLRLSQMEGCRFEPLPTRTAAIKDDEVITVKVISAGWKYGDAVISYPVLHEVDEKN